MNTATLINPMTHVDKSTALLNLMVSLWFPRAKARIDRSASAERKKKWAKLNPFAMQILIPPVGEGRYYLIDRPGALMLAHAPVPALTWRQFFRYLATTKPPEPPANAAIAALLEKGTSLDRIKQAMKEESTWSSPSALWKTQDVNGDDIILITGQPQTDDTLAHAIQSRLFQGFRFQSLVYTYNTPPDPTKPAYYTATLVADDQAFAPTERHKTLYVVNLGQFYSPLPPV